MCFAVCVPTGCPALRCVQVAFFFLTILDYCDILWTVLKNNTLKSEIYLIIRLINYDVSLDSILTHSPVCVCVSIRKTNSSTLSQWPRGLRRRSAAARLLRLWVRIPPVGMDVCLLWVLSGRGLCDELITHPEDSYWMWCVVVCDLQTSWMRRPWPPGGLSRQKQTNNASTRGIASYLYSCVNTDWRGYWISSV
jgi:hypothetical protein